MTLLLQQIVLLPIARNAFGPKKNAATVTHRGIDNLTTTEY